MKRDPSNSFNRDKRYSVLLWYRIYRNYKNNTARSSKILKEWNLTNAQYDILSRIAEAKTLSQQELAEQLLVTKANITQIIRKLEQLDLIKKKREWKTNYISLSQKGKSVYKESNQELEEFQHKFFKNLSIEEKKQLLSLLRKIEKS